MYTDTHIIHLSVNKGTDVALNYTKKTISMWIIIWDLSYESDPNVNQKAASS